MGTSAFQTQSQAAGTDAYHQKIDRIMSMNPGVNFLVPAGWYGNRPVTYSDGAAYDAGLASFRWMADPEGFFGSKADIDRNYVLTPEPTGPVETRVPRPYSWEIKNPYDKPFDTTGMRTVRYTPQPGEAELEAYQRPDGVWVDSSFQNPVLPPWWAFYTADPGINGLTGKAWTREEAYQLSVKVGASPAPFVATTPPPVFTLPQPIVPPVVAPGPAQVQNAQPLAPTGGQVLNANRPAESPVDSAGNTRTMTTDLLPSTPNVLPLSPGGAQVLPTNNTTATTVVASWRKYVPYALGIVALLLLVYAAKSRKRSS
jgi:hypothetical protein